ncbi:MAG: transglycosylase SLT domain-containing protein [candidate division WOR-3 bacterium]|jgi:soluble lytic murein transglycosylase-like protein
MRQVLTKVGIGITFAVIAVLAWQMIVLRNDLKERMELVDLLISRYEAKAQFVDNYLSIVNDYTGSEVMSKRILAAVYENSLQYELSPELILSVIKVESEFNPRAYSNVGAIGLMQVMPVTGLYVGRSLGLWMGSENDLFDIEKNIQIGVVFLKECIERLGEKKGLGYYYAGRNTQYYNQYTRKIDAAQELWVVKPASLTYNVQ